VRVQHEIDRFCAVLGQRLFYAMITSDSGGFRATCACGAGM